MDRRSIITWIITALLSLTLISAVTNENQQENELVYPDGIYEYYPVNDVPQTIPSKRAQTFVRFGKRAQTFVRFGKRAQTFVRFG
uniref:FMRFamide-like neuropeptides 16 (inferred by orthology to a C. elegans protein) n=1 Tax=Strongyloides venezuelensis TaxID=75913 RepID=A0A0K0FDG7_STRVS